MYFSKWDDTIHIFVVKFHKKYNVYPNILLACDKTYKKKDLYAQIHPDRLIDANNMETFENSNDKYHGISYFIADDYSLECCMNYNLQEGYFTLIFDEAPDFGGEPIEKPDDVENVFRYRMIA